MPKDKDYISIREYARRRGCSDTAVHKAYKEGLIQDSAFAWRGGPGDSRKKGIYPDKADAQWAKTISPSNTKNPELAKKVLKNAGEDPGSIDGPESGAGKQSGMNVQGGPSRAAAQRYEAVFKAKLRELEYKERAGELVNKDEVYSQLYAVGQEIRSALQAVPDRVIDDVRAAGNRNEAHQILFDAISDALEHLSEINERELID